MFSVYVIERGKKLVILMDCTIFRSPFLDVIRVSVSTASFLALLD